MKTITKTKKTSAFNIQKEEARGSIKQFMRVANVRKISLDNYYKYLNKSNLTGVHSVKFDIQDGYINLYNYGKRSAVKDRKTGEVKGYRYLCGKMIPDAEPSLYGMVYEVVKAIMSDEDMPSNVRRNVLVSMGR